MCLGWRKAARTLSRKNVLSTSAQRYSSSDPLSPSPSCLSLSLPPFCSRSHALSLSFPLSLSLSLSLSLLRSPSLSRSLPIPVPPSLCSPPLPFPPVLVLSLAFFLFLCWIRPMHSGLLTAPFVCTRLSSQVLSQMVSTGKRSDTPEVRDSRWRPGLDLTC